MLPSRGTVKPADAHIAYLLGLKVARIDANAAVRRDGRGLPMREAAAGSAAYKANATVTPSVGIGHVFRGFGGIGGGDADLAHVEISREPAVATANGAIAQR